MSRDLHNNERYFKELADKYEPAPPPMVWDGIEKVLDKDKSKKRTFPILWLFGILVLGATMFVNLSLKKDKEFPISEQEIISNDHQVESDPNLQDTRSVDSNVINEVNQGQDANTSETILTVSGNQEENKVDSETLKSPVTQQQQLSNLKASGVGEFSNTNTKNSSATTITKENIFKPGMATQSTLEYKNTIQVAPIQRLKWLPESLLSKIPLPDPIEKSPDILISELGSNPLPSSSWFLELGGGIGRNLSSPTLMNPAQEDFRLNTESSWYSWSASIQLGYQFDNLWYTSIGFDLNQTKYKFDFMRRNITSLVVNENQSFQIIKSDFFSIGEISHTFADIGLSFGRRINVDKWHFSLEGGAIFNLTFNANGKVQVGDLEFSRLEDQDGYFNTQIGIGARLSAMLDYPISDQLWVSAGPTYHQYFNTLSSDENPLQERNSILQVKVKVSYHF